MDVVSSITVEVPEPLASRLAAEAEARGVSAAQVAPAALTERFGPTRRRLGFAAMGASTSGRRAADAEEILADGSFGIDSADR